MTNLQEAQVTRCAAELKRIRGFYDNEESLTNQERQGLLLSLADQVRIAFNFLSTPNDTPGVGKMLSTLTSTLATLDDQQLQYKGRQLNNLLWYVDVFALFADDSDAIDCFIDPYERASRFMGSNAQYDLTPIYAMARLVEMYKDQLPQETEDDLRKLITVNRGRFTPSDYALRKTNVNIADFPSLTDEELERLYREANAMFLSGDHLRQTVLNIMAPGLTLSLAQDQIMELLQFSYDQIGNGPAKASPAPGL